MLNVNHRLDEDHRLIEPNVGDAELRGICFEHPNIRLQIVQPVDNTKIEIVLSDMVFLAFQTDFAQNVISDIFIYQRWEDAEFPPEMQLGELAKTKFSSSGRCIVVVRSIAGGPLVCAGRELAITVGTDVS